MKPKQKLIFPFQKHTVVTTERPIEYDIYDRVFVRKGVVNNLFVQLAEDFSCSNHRPLIFNVTPNTNKKQKK